MFRIKICGITCVDDALCAVEAGADAIGLNFYKKSPRYLEVETARQIAQVLPEGVAKVGLFVNEQKSWISEVFESVGLDWIQLHGNEPPELVRDLGDKPVLRAFRYRHSVGDETTGSSGADHQRYLLDCQRLGQLPEAVLADAYVPDQFGGTGMAVDWSSLSQDTEWMLGLPQILAGGLTPENVAEAIRVVRPYGVDTASGVERSPGDKDPELVRRFVEEAKRQFADLANDL